MQTPLKTNAANASVIFESLDHIKTELKTIAAAHGVSQVLLLTILNDWSSRQLKSEL